MNMLVYKIKKLLMRLFTAVRKQLRKFESRLDEQPPHPVLGIVAIVAGIALLAAGVAMLVLPGPGMLAGAAGIALVIIGFKIFGGKYGPERKERERKAKRERMRRRREGQR